MSKGKHKRVQRQSYQRASVVLYALQVRAQVICSKQGHKLGHWEPAKKKHGLQAMKAMCEHCGEVVFLMPFLCYSREHHQVPAMKGDLLFVQCGVTKV